MYTVTQTQIPFLFTTCLGWVWFCWYILFSSIVYQFNKSEYLSNLKMKMLYLMQSRIGQTDTHKLQPVQSSLTFGM